MNLTSNLADISDPIVGNVETTSYARVQPSMTDTAIPSSEILELIRGQARVEAKLDQFFSAQSAMKTEIDGLKTDIGSVKSDITEIKAQRRATLAYISALSAAAGVFWIFVGEKIKKIFGF